MATEEQEKAILIMPANNEKGTIGYAAKQALCLVQCGLISGFIVVDDGSTDGTGDIAARLGASVIRLEENRGKGEAVLEGFLYARREGAQVVLTADADLLFGLTPKQVAFMLGELSIPEKGMPLAMVVHSQREALTDLIAAAGRVHSSPMIEVSGFRAIRMAALDFIFEKAEGGWTFSPSQEATAFRKAAKGFGLETALNRLFSGRYRFLPEEHDIILTRPPFRKGYDRQATEVKASQLVDIRPVRMPA